MLSPAITEILRRIDDPSLVEKISFIFENAQATASVLRAVDFRRFEEKHYERGSEELWTELEPALRQALTQMKQFLALLRELFPPDPADFDIDSSEGDDFDDLEFDVMDDSGARAGATQKIAPIEPTKPARPVAEQVAELMQSYEPMLAQEVEQQLERLSSPTIRNEQWTLLGELVDFRDRIIGALHAMVAGICNVFQKVRAEELFTDARETYERLVALRRSLADLELDVDFYNRAIGKAENDELPMFLELLMGKLAEFSNHPSYQFLRPPQKQFVRQTILELGSQAQRLRPTSARQAADGFAKFLESMRTISLQEVLVDNDKLAAKEGREFLDRAAGLLRTDADQALFQVMHAVRRLGQLYGVDHSVDQAYQNLPDIEVSNTSPQSIADLIDELRVLFARFPY